jgi:hypothetical protein
MTRIFRSRKTALKYIASLKAVGITPTYAGWQGKTLVVVSAAPPPPPRSNPASASLPRNKWVTAQVRVTSSGKIQAKVPASALRSGTTRTRTRTHTRRLQEAPSPCR